MHQKRPDSAESAATPFSPDAFCPSGGATVVGDIRAESGAESRIGRCEIRPGRWRLHQIRADRCRQVKVLKVGPDRATHFSRASARKIEKRQKVAHVADSPVLEIALFYA
jgi:hypothetical protein